MTTELPRFVVAEVYGWPITNMPADDEHRVRGLANGPQPPLSAYVLDRLILHDVVASFYAEGYGHPNAGGRGWHRPNRAARRAADANCDALNASWEGRSGYEDGDDTRIAPEASPSHPGASPAEDRR